MKKFISKHIRIVVTLFIAIVMCVAILLVNGMFWAETSLELMKDLCDGFCITGFLLIAFGLLLFIGNDGTFTMLSYAVKKMFVIFKKDNRLGTYYDYKKNKIDNPSPFKYLLLVGMIFMAIGIVFLLIFMSIYPN